MEKEWYCAKTEINLVNEPYEARMRKQRARGMLEGRYGKWAYELKGIKPWKGAWIFNTTTLELKPAK